MREEVRVRVPKQEQIQEQVQRHVEDQLIDQVNEQVSEQQRTQSQSQSQSQTPTQEQAQAQVQIQIRPQLRALRTHCLMCDYPVFSHEQHICPECGERVDIPMMLARRRRCEIMWSDKACRWAALAVTVAVAILMRQVLTLAISGDGFLLLMVMMYIGALLGGFYIRYWFLAPFVFAIGLVLAFIQWNERGIDVFLIALLMTVAFALLGTYVLSGWLCGVAVCEGCWALYLKRRRRTMRIER